jgi:hypothetical protein
MLARRRSSLSTLLPLTATLAALFASGCSEDPGSSTATQGSASATQGSGTSSGGSSGKPSPVVFNEVSATGTDWIELGNATSEEADLEAFGLCDSDLAGQCDLTKALRFPAGTKVAPSAYLLILGDQPADAGTGPQTACLINGPSSCFYVPWKVSSSKGESVFIISPADEVLAELHYPTNAVAAGQTYGRLPDLTGEPAANAPTPGAANAPPP